MYVLYSVKVTSFDHIVVLLCIFDVTGSYLCIVIMMCVCVKLMTLFQGHSWTGTVSYHHYSLLSWSNGTSTAAVCSKNALINTA